MVSKIDLHIHSCYSGDTDADPEEMIQQGIERGLNGIAFTEHYYYGASEPVEGLRQKYSDRIAIFRGVEFSAAEGHCLIFGVDTDRLGIKALPVGEIVRIVSPLGGVVIPSHPFRSGNGMGDVVKSVEGLTALEGCNGANLHGFNLKAMRTAQELGLPYTGGSDAHAPAEVGSCYTRFSGSVTLETLVFSLRTGSYRGVDTRRVSRFLGHDRFDL